MKQLLLNISVLLLLTACGGNPSDTDHDPETDHTHHTEISGNNNEQPEATKVNVSPTATDSDYAFDPSRYKYEDGHIILTWEELAKVSFEEDYNEEFEEYILRPVFSDTLKALENKHVMVEGYVIPIEETGDETFIVLSGLPYLQCFFCGGAGPETVIDILPKGKLKKRLTTDQKITFKGKFRLNADDLDYLNYILDDAELVD